MQIVNDARGAKKDTRFCPLPWFPARLRLAVVLVAGCSSAPPPALNSDGIRETFGSYGVEVLFDDGSERQASLYSLDDGSKTCRTLALVRYLPLSGSAQRATAEAAAAIRAGASLGATFRDAGWKIDKTTLYAGDLELPDGETRLHGLMRIDGRQRLAMHVYRFQIMKDSLSIDFAEIIEVHHPEYLDVAGIEGRFGTGRGQCAACDDPAVWRQRVLHDP